MKTIKDLTPEIRAKIPLYLSKARNFYNGDLPFNRKASELYIRYLYKLAGEKQPLKVVFADNPNQYKIYWSVLKGIFKKPLSSELYSELYSELRSGLSSELDSELSSELRSELSSELYSELDSELDSELYSELYSELRSELSSELDSELYSELDSELSSELYSELRSGLSSELNSTLSRSHYLWICSPYTRCYLTWYQFISKEFQLGNKELVKKLNTLYQLIIQSSIQRCWFTKGYVLVLKNPKSISFLNGRLHNEKRAALDYGNWKKYFWKGFEVPEKLILSPENITIQDVKEANKNAEVRRAFIEKLGVTKFFDILSGGSGLNVIDEDTDHQGYPMRLLSFDFEGDDIQVLEVTDPSTDRVYNIYPPSQNCSNVWEAKADTFNKESLSYRQGDVGLVDINQKHEKPLIET